MWKIDVLLFNFFTLSKNTVHLLHTCKILHQRSIIVPCILQVDKSLTYCFNLVQILIFCICLFFSFFFPEKVMDWVEEPYGKCHSWRMLCLFEWVVYFSFNFIQLQISFFFFFSFIHILLTIWTFLSFF